MRVRAVMTAALPTLCLLLQLGCAARMAPARWLPHAEEARQEAYGGWIEMHVGSVSEPRMVQGELLAISDDSVYTLRDTTVTASALALVRSAMLEVYDPRNGEVAGMTLAGTLLTVTHGWGLIVTAPLWVIVGSSSAAVLSHEGRHRIRRTNARAGPAGAPPDDATRASWRDLRLYARFPQGLPPLLDRTRLHERPLHVRVRIRTPDPRSITNG